MRFFSFVLTECLALAIWDTTHAWAIFFAVMGFVMLWAMQMPWEGIRPVNGTRNGAEPKGIIKANGTQETDLGAELWAGDVADEIIAEMKEKGEW
jgi:hypothetical protein